MVRIEPHRLDVVFLRQTDERARCVEISHIDFVECRQQTGITQVIMQIGPRFIAAAQIKETHHGLRIIEPAMRRQEISAGEQQLRRRVLPDSNIVIIRQRRDGLVARGIPAPHGKGRDRAKRENNHQRNEHKRFDAPPKYADLQKDRAGRSGESKGLMSRLPVRRKPGNGEIPSQRTSPKPAEETRKRRCRRRPALCPCAGFPRNRSPAASRAG